MQPNVTNPVGPVPAQPMQPVQPPQLENFFNFWHIPGTTIFSAVKAVAVLSPGKLVVKEAASGQELYNLALTPDIKLRNMMGAIKLAHVNGQDMGMFNKKYVFYFYNPKLLLLSYLVIFMHLSEASRFKAACLAAAGVA